jgi:hypothetical protein
VYWLLAGDQQEASQISSANKALSARGKDLGLEAIANFAGCKFDERLPAPCAVRLVKGCGREINPALAVALKQHDAADYQPGWHFEIERADQRAFVDSP